ncbi:site-specific integrase [Natronospirillum operosum]|uniref:Site-specific integrase n=1 Tax=Natronospirillum operosum TaxID=2759953 RepID=A0A4Z0WAK3_9GAMM|nr:site-specific integrase [Natronospirillum operosum]TGG95679.1 site-specific integrase [Natronospirillum operosum]
MATTQSTRQPPPPIFDQLAHLPDPFARQPEPVPSHLPAAARTVHEDDFWHALRFLASYEGSTATFNAYRRELERLLQWSWLVQEKSIRELRREDIEQFIRFCQDPPRAWIGTKNCARYRGPEGERKAHPDWRPFVVTVSKVQTRAGKTADPGSYASSQASIKSLFAILSSFFNFLIQEEAVTSNPVALIRQKSKFLVSGQRREVRRLSNLQWDFVLETAELMAAEDPDHHERTLFVMQCLYAMYLRISELVADERHVPTMSDFHRDSDNNWWFEVVGKGNKARSVSVSNAMLAALKRYRLHLGLTPLPVPGERTPLVPALGGRRPVTSTRHIRAMVQNCFDQAVERMRLEGLADESYELQAATVHWLRHTGISEDVKVRPVDHVRDDAGHASSLTTDRYIDAERRERHASARNKPMKTDS